MFGASKEDDILYKETEILDSISSCQDELKNLADRLGECNWNGSELSAHERLNEIFDRFDSVLATCAQRLGECHWDNRELSVHDRLTEIFARLGKCNWGNREWSVHERLTEILNLLKGDAGEYAKILGQDRFDKIMAKMERWFDIVCPDSGTNQAFSSERLDEQYKKHINHIGEQETRLKSYMANLEKMSKEIDSLLPAVSEKMSALALKEKELLQTELELAEKIAQLEKEQPAQMRELHAQNLTLKEQNARQKVELKQQVKEVNRQRQENAALKDDLETLKKLCLENNIDLPHRLAQYK